MSDKDEEVIVIDTGSGVTKAGFSGYETPKVVFPTRIAYSENQSGYLIGDDFTDHQGAFSVKYPIERSSVKNWDDLEKIWDYIFSDKLKTDPEKHAVLLTEAPNCSKPHKEKIAELMFERFDVPAIYSEIAALLSMYGNSRTTGIVLDSGEGITHALAVSDGYILPGSIFRTDFGGCDLTAHLSSLLKERGYDFTTEKQIVQDIKEKLCYIAPDFEQENKIEETIIEKNYELPDGQVITVGKERFLCTEETFRPSSSRTEHHGVAGIIYDSILKCDMDIRKELFGNIILSGGNTMFPGFSERTEKELISLAPAAVTVKIVKPSDRKYSAWIGGSLLASLVTFNDMLISKSEYYECGPKVMYSK